MHEFLLDSGSNSHIVKNTDKVQNLQATDKKVIVGRNQAIDVNSIGDLLVTNAKGVTLKLENVLVIKGFGRNIISMKRLVQGGCKFSGTEKKVTFKKNNFELTAKLEPSSGFYVFDLYKCESWEEASEITTKKKMTIDINEAHDLLGHVGETILRHTWNKRGFTVTRTLDCESCAITKARQKPTRAHNLGGRSKRIDIHGFHGTIQINLRRQSTLVSFQR